MYANHRFSVATPASTTEPHYVYAVHAKALSDSRTSASSHAKYSSLTPMEKDKQMKNLQQSLQQTKQRLQQLEAEAQLVLERDGIQLSQADADDVSAVVKELSQSVEDNFPEESPQRIFWNQQKQYHQLKDRDRCVSTP